MIYLIRALTWLIYLLSDKMGNRIYRMELSLWPGNGNFYLNLYSEDEEIGYSVDQPDGEIKHYEKM